MKLFTCTSCVKPNMYLGILMILYSDFLIYSCSSCSLSLSFLFSSPQPLYTWQPFACERPICMVSGVFPRRAFRTYPRVAQDQPVLPYRLWTPVWIHLTSWTKNWSDSVNAAVMVFPWRAFWTFPWVVQNLPVLPCGLWMPVWIHLTLYLNLKCAHCHIVSHRRL